MKYYFKVKQFAIETFPQDEEVNKVVVRHLKRTAYWVRQLKPEADEALLIAAVVHDIERAFPNEDKCSLDEFKEGFEDPDYLRPHEKRSAEIAAEFLKAQGADESLVEQVKDLILHHELGGTEDQNILKDADSISFFENVADYFIEKRVSKLGKDVIRDKFNWMYSRITSEKAKETAGPMYENALRELEIHA